MMLRRRERSRRLMPRGLLMPERFPGRLGLGHGDRRIGLAAHRSAGSTLHPLPDYFRHRLIDGARVSLLLANAELGQHVDDGMRGDFELPCELVDSNFTHK